MQPGSTRVVKRMIEAAALAMALAMVGSGVALGAAPVDDLEPPTPAAFLPGGLLGVQLGGAWEDSKKSKLLRDLACETVEPQADVADEVCFFKSPAASQVGGGRSA